MVFNSFLGRRKIIRAMLRNEKSDVLFTKGKKIVIGLFGHIVIYLFGYPLFVSHRLRSRSIFKLLRNEHGKILDVGCSFGVNTFELAKNFDHVIGLDINKTSIKLGKEIKNILKFQNVSFNLGDILNSAIADQFENQFDVAIMVDVLEHISNDSKAINNLNRILKKGGILIIAVPYEKRW